MSGSSTPMDTSQLPPDPTKGLPQLFRSRRLSSDFSEDGESASSRRNSISNGTAVARATGNGVGVSTVSAAAESGLVGTSDNNRSMVVAMGKEGVDREMKALVTEGTKMLSASVVVQKLNVFDVAFSKKLTESQDRQKLVEQTQQAQPTSQTEAAKDTCTTATTSSGEAPPMLTKPVKPDLPVAQPAQPVVFQKPQPPSQARVLPPPPLKLMSPTSEHPNPNLPTQQPPLSPLTTRSPVQFAGMPRMPVLSPLRTPTSANRHPIRIPGSYTHPTAGSPLLSPPSLRSPVDTVPTPIDAHLHGGTMPLSTASQAPHVHGAPPQIPYNAHPPSQPPPLVQAQATPTPTPSSQAIMPTSAISSKDTVIAKEVGPVEIEEALATTQPVAKVEQKMPATGGANLPHVQMPAEVVAPPAAARKRPQSESSALSISPSPPPTPIAEKSDTELIPKSPISPEKDATTVEEQSSPRSTVEENEERERETDTLQVLQAERLSASPVSAEENIITPQSSPEAPPKITAPAMIEETSLKDLEISDDGLSDEEEEEEEGEGRGNKEAPLITVKPSSPQQHEEEVEQESTLNEETRLSAPPSTGGKKLMKELLFSPISSPGSEFEAEPEIESGKREEASPAQDVIKQSETDLLVEAEAEKEPITSPETFLDVSSDEERVEETSDRPIAASQAVGSELIEGQDDVGIEQKPGDTKVEVLDSASIPYGNDNVQDMGTVEEVLEVLEQKLSSDEESDESEEEEEEGEEHKLVEEVEPESVGVASEIGGDVVSGEGVMVGGEEEDDMVETLSAMVHTEQQQQQQPTCTLTTVTTESVSHIAHCTCFKFS